MKREKVVIVQSRLHCISNISTFCKGECNDATESMTAPWKKTVLLTIISNYEPRNIFSADEFGLFSQALPKKTLNLKGEKCSGGKNSKDSTNRPCSCKYDWRKASNVCHWKVAKTTLF